MAKKKATAAVSVVKSVWRGKLVTVYLSDGTRHIWSTRKLEQLYDVSPYAVESPESTSLALKRQPDWLASRQKRKMKQEEPVVIGRRRVKHSRRFAFPSESVN